ncbi:hypothetical protein P1X14_12390 [Sphingomonas sp. AOB5]|uniref:hypothetical protein n=1 Tax=Sphingomonas sp. AOB5 TaxID=3034017 RepID=UPI0023F80708|nr:hypothetical protein [Sphingomonas sp. AOB5]MDF7776049.1 hypothetical protein [Sphingomonas sp. AOB5]
MAKQINFPGTKPTHRLYRVEGDGKNARWIEIGAAWRHGDEMGFSLHCGAMPLHGRIVMRAITERAARPAREAA